MVVNVLFLLYVQLINPLLVCFSITRHSFSDKEAVCNVF